MNQTEEKRAVPPEELPNQAPLIIGIGASAGGLEALQ